MRDEGEAVPEVGNFGIARVPAVEYLQVRQVTEHRLCEVEMGRKKIGNIDREATQGGKDGAQWTDIRGDFASSGKEAGDTGTSREDGFHSG